MTNALIVPENINTIPLPAKCPELNPVENVGQFMRDNWFSNRVLESYDEIVDHCCDACNKLIELPSRIMSIGNHQRRYEGVLYFKKAAHKPRWGQPCFEGSAAVLLSAFQPVFECKILVGQWHKPRRPVVKRNAGRRRA